MQKKTAMGIVLFFLSFSLYGNEDFLFEENEDEIEIIDSNSGNRRKRTLFPRLRNRMQQRLDRALEDIDSSESYVIPALLKLGTAVNFSYEEISQLQFIIDNAGNIDDRISMQEAYNNKDGACAFRALLGIAETRVRQNLTLDQLVKAREMYYGSIRSNNWWVVIRRADGRTQGASNALEDVINIGLELLESNERALFINRFAASPDDTNIPRGTQATFIRVSSVSTSNYHFLEGDANGNVIYDPLHNLDYFLRKDIIGFDAIRFFTPD